MKILPLLPLLFAAGAAGPQTPDPPAFPASVNAVAIDVMALDAEGLPVTDLRPHEFVVKLDGTPRRVVSARYRSYAGQAPREGDETEDTRPPFSSNHSFTPGRIVAIVVDQVQLGPGRSRILRALAEHFVPKLGPRDAAMVATLPGPNTRVPFTADRAKLSDALSTITGAARAGFPRIQLAEAMAYAQGDSTWRQVTERECPEGRAADSVIMARNCMLMLESEARAVLETFNAENMSLVNGLRGLVASLRQVPGPKRVVLLTAGFGDEGGSELPTLMQEADAARVSFHVILLDTSREVSQARVQRGSSEERYARMAGAARLSGLSGGSLLRVVGDGESVAARLAGELSGDYALGFEAAAAEMNDAGHALSVEVTRPGVSARTWGRIRLQASASGKPEAVLAAALRSRDLYVDLPVKVATYALREPPSEKTKIVVAAELGDRSAPPPGVSVAFLLSDGAGRVVATGFQPPSETAPDHPALFLGSAQLAPGLYRLRLAALDANGRIGSVEHPVSANVAAAGGLEIGDLILAPSGSESGAPRPSVDLDLHGSDLVNYLELYAEDSQVLDASSVTFRVLGRGEEDALLSAPGDIRSEAGSRRLVQRTVEAGLLPPGDYVAEAEIAVRGETVRRLSRPFRVGGSQRAEVAAPVSFDDAVEALPPFDAASVLEPDVLTSALERLQSRSKGPAARAALQRAREGRVRELGELADGDPLASPFLRGLALYAGGDSGAAADQFRATLRAGSDFFPAAFYLGACYASQGKNLEAAGAWQMSLIGGGGGPVHRLIGEALLRGRQAEQAVEALLEPGPPEGTTLRALGLAYSLTGRRAEAVTALGGYLDTHPDDLSTALFTLRLMFADYAARGAEFEERPRLERYAQAYVAAGGPQRALVERWLSHLARE
jgi:VWFA-related protein